LERPGTLCRAASEAIFEPRYLGCGDFILGFRWCWFRRVRRRGGFGFVAFAIVAAADVDLFPAVAATFAVVAFPVPGGVFLPAVSGAPPPAAVFPAVAATFAVLVAVLFPAPRGVFLPVAFGARLPGVVFPAVAAIFAVVSAVLFPAQGDVFLPASAGAPGPGGVFPVVVAGVPVRDYLPVAAQLVLRARVVCVAARCRAPAADSQELPA